MQLGIPGIVATGCQVKQLLVSSNCLRFVPLTGVSHSETQVSFRVIRLGIQCLLVRRERFVIINCLRISVTDVHIYLPRCCIRTWQAERLLVIRNCEVIFAQGSICEPPVIVGIAEVRVELDTPSVVIYRSIVLIEMVLGDGPVEVWPCLGQPELDRLVGVFESVIELPEGYDLGQAKAAYQNGFLRIDVPQKKRQASKNIAVLVKDEQ